MAKKKDVDQNKVKPYFNATWPLFIILLAMGYLLNYEVFSILNVNLYLEHLPLYVYLLIALFSGYVLAIIVYNLGKIIYAKAKGFKLIYMSFFGLTFRRKGDKIKFSLSIIEGLGIQLEYAPIKNQDKIEQYHKAGYISSLIYEVVVIALAVVFLVIGKKAYSYFFMVLCFFTPFIEACYQVKYRTDTINDGFTRRLIKDPKSRQYYVTNLMNEYKLATGDNSLEVLPVLEDDYDPFVIKALEYNYFAYLLQGDIFNAEKACNMIVEKEEYACFDSSLIVGYIGIVYFMCYQGLMEKATDFYFGLTSNKKHVVASKKNIFAIKSALYVYGFMDVSWENYYAIKSNLDKIEKNAIYPGIAQAEIKEAKKVIQKIEEKYPDWIDEE